MTGAAIVAGGGIGLSSPITASANWGTQSGAATQTSPSRTLTVPGGNSGKVDFVVAGSGGTPDYKQAAGAFTTCPNGTQVTFTTGQALQFRETAGASDAEISVIDHDTGTLIGFWNVTTS